ncbi:phospholipase D family protein [Xylophilus rhododendri]|uniref:Phospholipase D family protein n=1 Tax=Xylophilus rhododendri TaxID=2697032 RepID=A0A857J2F9_9BURK|nr:phospholipase D family protein [Xylophilus rhododendri]QHI97926.1 phospholipase D family protein [Xylophilus rhododendri]
MPVASVLSPHLRRASCSALAALGFAALLSGCAGLPANEGRVESKALQDPSATTLATRIAADAPTDTQARHRAGFRLLGDVESAYGARLALIDTAEKTIDLQYYSIHYDRSTEALLQRVRAAAARGVRVRMLIDDFNAGGENARVLRMDEVPGIEVRLFNPVQGPRNWQPGRLFTALFDFQRIQQRMHNKALIADNVLAVTGGRNLGDEYFGQDSKSNFLDLDVLVAGALVRQISGTFDAYWNNPLAYPAATLLTQQERQSLDRKRKPQPDAAPAQGGESHPADTSAAAAPAEPDSARPVPGSAGIAQDIEKGTLKLNWAPATYVADHPEKISGDEPDDEDETVVDGMINLIQRAKSDLLIVSPYFVPGAEMMKAFEGIRARGVRIRVLTNSLASNDAPLAHVGYARYRKALLALGIELYELKAMGETERRFLGSTPQSRSSLHAKTLVMDGRLLVVGTMNLDLRSALQNTEQAIVIRSRSLSGELTPAIEQALQDSYRPAMQDGRLVWHVPASDKERAGQVLTSEPDASTSLKLMVDIAGPFAPEEML